MKYTEFKMKIGEGEISPIYLFEGQDAYFLNRGISLLKTLISEPSLNYSSYEGEDVDITQLLASLESFPFMSDKRLVVIREFYPDKKIISQIKEYLENPAPFCIFAIQNSMPFEGLKKFEKITVVDCGKQDSSLLVRVIRSTCDSRGIKIDGETAKLIIDYCLGDMSRIEKEVEKLTAYALDDKVITAETVNLLVTKDTEFKIYEMTDYVGKKKFDSALYVINELLGKGETYQRLIVSVYNYFRRLLHVSICDADNTELSRLLGIQEFAVRKTKEQAKAFKIKNLKRAVDMLIDTDFNFKSGAIDIEEGTWTTLFKIMIEE